MNYQDIKKRKAIEQRNKARWLEVNPHLTDESGIYIIMARNGREIYVTGHSEYSPYTLDYEYRRDLAKGINPDIPKNYYPDDNPGNPPEVRWRSHANLLFSNWLNYFVYQETPYNIKDIK